MSGSRLLATNQSLTSYVVCQATFTYRNFNVVAGVGDPGPASTKPATVAPFSGPNSAATNQWSLTFRVQAHEPVVLVDERFSLGDTSKFVLSLGTSFAPESLFYRDSQGGGLRAELAATNDASDVFVWQPWVQWWLPRRGKWFGLYNAQSPDLLMLGARDADLWVDPSRPQDASAPVRREPVATLGKGTDHHKLGVDAFLESGVTSAPVRREGADLVVSLPLRAGERRWMLGAFSKEACLEILKERKKPEDELYRTPLPQEYVIKYEFPLDRVKDYVLHWRSTE
ncbi:MAG: hypothetical protein HYV36_04090, partial [Lentisphaerae bacterium]|nr:hypothetical protein [Lentisphaerota bacterium]